MYVGKVGMFLLVVMAGILGIEPILNLLGEGGGDSGSIAGIILLYLMWLIVALMAKWDSIFKKNKKRENEVENEVENENLMKVEQK